MTQRDTTITQTDAQEPRPPKYSEKPTRGDLLLGRARKMVQTRKTPKANGYSNRGRKLLNFGTGTGMIVRTGDDKVVKAPAVFFS